MPYFFSAIIQACTHAVHSVGTGKIECSMKESVFMNVGLEYICIVSDRENFCRKNVPQADRSAEKLILSFNELTRR